jgi:hypothetical protein
VRWHQDATYFETDPVSVTTFWFALEDATLDNGCLWAELVDIARRCASVLREGDLVRVEKLDAAPWPDDSTAVPLEVKAGSLVCFHGLAALQRAEPLAGIAPRLHPACHRWRNALFAVKLDTARCQLSVRGF